MLEKRFQKKIENFICQNCGKKVQGKGYTDHCPDCLWSKHVDIYPGDRNSKCHGLMKPIDIEIKSDKYIIHYQCVECGFKHRVKSFQEDNINKIIQLTNQFSQ